MLLRKVAQAERQAAGCTTRTKGCIKRVSSPFDRVIRGTVVTTDTVLPRGYIALRDETIAAIGQGEPPPAGETIDHGDDLILPGLVDGHMHTSSSTGWPGIESATRCAAAGGVTTCCDMPYDVPKPVTDTAILTDKIGWVERTSYVDMALYGTITKTGGVHAIPELAAGGISAFKLSTYEYDAIRFPRIDHPTMLAAFHAIAKTGLPCAMSCCFSFLSGSMNGAGSAVVGYLPAPACCYLRRPVGML